MQNKVLIISGIHGDERHAVEIVSCFKDLYPYMDIVTELNRDSKKIEIDFLEMVNIEGIKANTRGYTVDLNRSYNLVDPLKDVKEFIESGDYDLILDVHNSYSCKDLLLFSNSQDELISTYERFNQTKLTWKAQKGSLKDIYPEYNIITIEYNIMDTHSHDVENSIGLLHDTIDHYYKMNGGIKESINKRFNKRPTKLIEKVYCKEDVTIFVDIKRGVVTEWDLESKEITKSDSEEFFKAHEFYTKDKNEDGDEIKIPFKNIEAVAVSWERGFVKSGKPVVFIEGRDYNPEIDARGKEDE